MSFAGALSFKHTITQTNMKKNEVNVYATCNLLIDHLLRKFVFCRSTRVTYKRDNVVSHVVVDNNVFAPYNDLATLHKREAFWALYLPVTVTRDTADLWRYR